MAVRPFKNHELFDKLGGKIKNKSKNNELLRGIALGKKKDPRAVKIFTELLRKEERPIAKASYYWHRGNAYYRLGLYHNAIEDYTMTLKTRALAHKPPLAAAFHGRGNAYLMRGDYQNAVKDYTKEIQLNQVFDEAYLNRAKAYVRLGKFKQAKHDLEMALAVTKRPDFIYKNFSNLKPPTMKYSWLEWLKLHKTRAVFGTIFAVAGSGCLLLYVGSMGFLNFLNALLISGVIMIVMAFAAFNLIRGISLPYLDIGCPPEPLRFKKLIIESDQDIRWPSY